MTKAELKSQFQNSYKRESWMPILKLVFGQINYFTDPFSLFEGEEAVKQGCQIGYVDLPNNQTVAIFEIEVADRIIIERNRKGLRDIAVKYIKGTFSAALVFYYSKNQNEYRFSFIAQQSKIDEQTGEHSTVVTAPKRYTYVLGTPFCATAAERWIKLAAEPEINVDKITDAFSVEKLSKEFFDQYKIQYTRFCKFIEDDSVALQQFIDHTETDAVKAQKPLRDYVKKLLGRLVFLQFLQKKGWMGVPATNKDWKGGDFNFMANLFNKSTNQDNFLDQVLEPLFFETLNSERTNDIAIKVDNTIKIPYLNGGLFDPTTLDATDVQFPKHYFSELFEFFNQYNFTIDENDPDDAEIGIDPEMLGHIFENLLEDNKDKGAFYTPKEIVRYMCQESLIAYLLTHTAVELHQPIERLIRTHIVDVCLQDKPNATLIQKLLVAVKICDPAIGSGAFPMGMLYEIFMVRRHLFSFLGKNESFSACLVKKEIIQNNIYGVDIEQGAVDIARLRFWLALVVDEDVPQALPNLDYKIVCGNSLISRFSLDCDINEVFEEYNRTEDGKKEPLTLQRYKDEVANYTDEHLEKATQKKKIEAIKNAFKMYLSFSDRTQIKKLAKKVVSYDGLFGVQKIDLKNAKLKEAYDKNEELKTQISNLQNQQQEVLINKLYENSFEWRFEFPALLDDDGNFTGFDLVIGNPPYIGISKLEDKNKLQKQRYTTFESTGDLYSLFYEKGNELLKLTGHLCYITSNKWLRAGYGKSLRKYFIEKTNPIKLIDFGQTMIFETAVVHSNILIFQNQQNAKLLQAVQFEQDLYKKNLSIHGYFSANKMTINHFDENIWTIASNSLQMIKTKAESVGIPLKSWALKINFGIKTGYNEAFIIDENTKNKLIEEDVRNSEIIKPILRGRDVRKYSCNFNNLWIINSHNGIRQQNIPKIEVERDFPCIFRHLSSFLPKAELRSDQGDHWTNLRNCAYINEFSQPKIVFSEIVSEAQFHYDEKGYYPEATVFFMTGANLKYLIALLNSKPVTFIFKTFYAGGELVGKFRYKKAFLENLPIPIIKQNQQMIFENLVDQILSSKQENPQLSTTSLEQHIDTLVYKLYELSYEEVLLIEPDFGKRVSAEQYQDVNVVEYEAVNVE